LVLIINHLMMKKAVVYICVVKINANINYNTCYELQDAELEVNTKLVNIFSLPNI
jgi:hypothetical protein